MKTDFGRYILGPRPTAVCDTPSVHLQEYKNICDISCIPNADVSRESSFKTFLAGAVLRGMQLISRKFSSKHNMESGDALVPIMCP